MGLTVTMLTLPLRRAMTPAHNGQEADCNACLNEANHLRVPERQAKDGRVAQLVRPHECNILLRVGRSERYAHGAQSGIAQPLCDDRRSALLNQAVGIEPKRHAELLEERRASLEHAQPEQGLASTSECDAVVLARSDLESRQVDLLGARRVTLGKACKAACRRDDKAGAARLDERYGVARVGERKVDRSAEPVSYAWRAHFCAERKFGVTSVYYPLSQRGE